MNRRVYICTVGLGAVILSALGLALNSAAQSVNNPATWPAAERDLSNSRNQPVENLFNAGNVSSLTTRWVFRTGGDVSATPTVGADAVYVPGWAGNLYATWL
jgi:polyvinyl alcohol dehydrogenase (cytochrome)